MIDNIYSNCTLCPRRCGVDRASGELGICGMDSRVFAARAALHMWEEPCVSGERGSGAVFFTGCPLGCVFCQNAEISRMKKGYELGYSELAEIFLRLQNESHANNINLVTAQHFAPTVARALESAKRDGLTVPIVYNSSGYESSEALSIMDGLVDVYLPDMKYFDADLSQKYSRSPDYFESACGALDEMFRQVGEPQFSSGRRDIEDGIITRGMIVRHLVLPTHTDDSKSIITYLHKRFGNGIYISIMNQYTPMDRSRFPELSRPLTDEEYNDVVNFAVDIGVENGFIQEGGTVAESFIPAFNGEGIIPQERQSE